MVDFEKYRPGDTFVSDARTITEADVVLYNMFTGDWDRRVGSDGDWLVPDMQAFSIGLCLLGTVGRNVWMPETLIAFYGFDEICFHRSLKVGDTIRSRVTVADVTTKGDERGILVYLHETLDQHGSVVLSSTHRALMTRAPAAALASER